MSPHGPPRRLDPDLARLLLAELEKHAPALGGGTAQEQRRALHALKGSAGIAGERGFAEALARLERRLIAGDVGAIEEAALVVEQAMISLRKGSVPKTATWPEPPHDLRAEAIDPALAAHYRAEMHDRLARLDDALAAEDDEVSIALTAFRDVHAMKGAAHTVGDEVTAWFCHGLEDLLRQGQRSPEQARRAVAETARFRGVLAEMIAAPDRAVEALRALANPPASIAPDAIGGLRSLAGPGSTLRPPKVPSIDPNESESRPPRADGLAEDATLRVPAALLERLLDRVQLFGLLRGDLLDGSRSAATLARDSRVVRGELAEALRLIGPPKPWGAPAAAIERVDRAIRRLAELATGFEQAATAMNEAAETVRVEAVGAHRDLAGMRTVKAGWICERVAAAVGAQARREGREVRVVWRGQDTPIDRRMAEQLVDPLLQLARNAVAHGIEPAPERAMRGKPRHGTLEIAVEASSEALRFTVRDDGAGVDVADVRRRAVARGTLAPETASTADDETLLALLFVPGFTTKDSADLLAGRGVGLDLALESAHRLGGTLRLMSQPGMGLTATLEVPFEAGLLRVLWIRAGGATFGLPVRAARRILLGRDPEAASAVSLAACLGAADDAASRPSAPPSFVVEVDPLWAGARPILFAVDAVGIVEEVALRAVSPIVLAAGPYGGVVARGAELRLCLDPRALGELAARGPR